jgi:hypothetical protein
LKHQYLSYFERGFSLQNELLVELSKVLSKGFPHVRVDFYEVDGRVYFGELTFYHFSGFQPFIPAKWDKVFGDWLKLPINNKNEKS